jgi:hypothetical protein
MMRLASASHYLHTFREDETLPSLDAALKESCREHVRRVDRFIKLALIGSARCAAHHTLRRDCAVYLGSGFGPIGSNIAAQEQMFRDHETPSPYHFVNTLGSSAGFHVAKNLGLTGQNLFITRRGASFMAVLTAAAADLALGVMSQALVGVVEEVNLPLEDHRRRRGLAPETAVAEASHWLLLEAGGSGGRPLELRHFSAMAALEAALLSSAGPGDRVRLAQGLEGDGVERLLRRFPQDPEPAGHDDLEAAWVCGLAAGGAQRGLSLADGGPGRGYSLLHLGA